MEKIQKDNYVLQITDISLTILIKILTLNIMYNSLGNNNNNNKLFLNNQLITN